MKTESRILVGSLLTEFKTVSAMIDIYCRHHHGSDVTPCDECKSLRDYAETRLDRCPYGENKPTCNKCPIHCYKPEPKQQMKAVMRFSGPRMLLPHPFLAIRHLLHERRAVPQTIDKEASNRHKRLKANNK